MAKGQVIEVLPSGKRRSITKPKKPADTVYVQLPAERPAELYEFEDEAGKVPQYLDAALQGVMTELGARDDQAKVTVKRITSTSGVKKEEWLYECHPSQFSVPDLQEYYGAGDYRITVYGQQEGSNYKIVHADKRLSIGNPKSGRPKALEHENFPVAVAMRDPNDLTRAIASAISGPMQALVQTLAGMMPKATSRADAIAELTQMATLMQTLRGAEPAQVNPLDALEKAVQLMQANKGAAAVLDENGDVSPNAVLIQGMQLVKEFFSAAKAQPAAAPVALPAPARPAAPAAPAAPVSEDEAMKLMLKLQMKMFLNAAVNASDPLTYATILYEQAPDEIIAKLQGDDWFAELCKIEPGFAQHREWCEQVRAEVLQAIAEENAPPEGGAPLTAPGDKGINSADEPASGATAPGQPARHS